LRSLRTQPPLASLWYAYQWRRDDPRPLVSAMKTLAASTADFSAGRLF
jgi:hypothetical protein